MKPTSTLALALLIAALLAAPGSRAAAQDNQDPIAASRNLIKTDRQMVVKHTLQLTEAESEKFWPLYQEYRAEMDKVGDGLVKVIREYASQYPDVPEDRARKMLEQVLDLDKQQAATRASFLNRFAKILPAPKNLRFAQVDRRFDLAVQLNAAADIPLVPIEGRLIPQATGVIAAEPGVPGGAVLQMVELTATVTAIDQATRKITLLSPGGIKETVIAGPDVINFDQIRVGDELKVRATEELVVQMAEPGESANDGSAGVLSLAEKGAQPGGIAAAITQATATITAIDPQKRTATMRFADGSTRTFHVRTDVDLANHHPGEQVVFRYTGMVAVRLEKP